MNNPYMKMLEEAKAEDYAIRILENENTTVVPSSSLCVDDDGISYVYAGKDYRFDVSRLENVQVLPSTRCANIILRRNSTGRALIQLVPLFVGMLALVFADVFPSWMPFSQDGTLGFGIGMLITGYSLTYFFLALSKKESKSIFQRALGSVSPLIKGLSSSNEEEYFTKLIQINLRNIEEYYNLIKMQTNNSFRMTLCCAVGGFSLLCFGIIAGFNGASNQVMPYIAASSGVVVNFISAIFFYLYNNTVRQLNIYHNKLVDVQDTMLSLKVAQLIDDKELKNKTMDYLTRALTSRLLQSNGADS